MEKPKNKIWDVRARRLELVSDTYLGYIVLIVLCTIWYFASKRVNSELILPSFEKTLDAFIKGWTSKRIMSNFGITLKRVLTGVGYSIIVGTIIGIGMGYSKKVYNALSPVINSIRQIPIMTWVPLSIIWFGLGEGPTIFLIFMSAVFPLTINVIDGVANVEQNLKYAAKSMGASLPDIIKDIIVPGAFPSFLTGVRLAIGGGWQSVIWAEFIATSSGIGFIMVEAQNRLNTSTLYALMIMAAIIGFVIDQLLRLVERSLTRWRYRDGVS